MSKLQRIVVAALVTMGGATGLLVVTGPMVALGQDDVMHGDVSVLADSPWDRPTP